jgi:predicted nucleotidyltransferase
LTRIGNQKHFQANAASPLFSELRNIVLKTVGLAEPLRDALKPLSSAIRAAFVYGSVARATDQSASDIDLMIISDNLTYGEVFGALGRATQTVGRQINPTVYTVAEFSKRSQTENAFVTRVLEQPKLWVIGSEHDLPDTLGLGPEVWRVLSKAHDTRNRTEYEGAIDVDERLLADLIKACRTVADKVNQLRPIPRQSK